MPELHNSTSNPHPVRLYLDFIFQHRRPPGALLSLDIETVSAGILPPPESKSHSTIEVRDGLGEDALREALLFGFTADSPPDKIAGWPYNDFLAKASAAGLTPPRAWQNQDALNSALLRIGSIQVMDSAGQFAYFEGDESDILKQFWSIFPQDGGLWPAIITYNGAAFDLPVLENRSRFKGPEVVGLPRRFITTSKWGDRPGIRHLDLAEHFNAGTRTFMKLDHVARACGLPGKPEHLACDAAAFLASDDPDKRRRALDYMAYDVLAPLQIAMKSGVVYDRLHYGAWERQKDRGAAFMSSAYLLPSHIVSSPTPMTDPLPESHAQLLRIIGATGERRRLAATHAPSSIKGLHRDVADLLADMQKDGTVEYLFDAGFYTAAMVATGSITPHKTTSAGPEPVHQIDTLPASAQRLFRSGAGMPAQQEMF